MIYLDHAATTPPRPEARAALMSWLEAANASAAHVDGQRARAALEQAREVIAQALGCSPHEVVFTSGGTEADNLAVKGVVWAARERRRGRVRMVTSAVEHAAVGQAARWLADRGDVELAVVPVDRDGRVEVERVLDAVDDDTVLVSVMAANNETGVVNDVAAIATALADHPCVVHTDAVQAFATLDLDVEAWRVDALALSAHKFGGPQGVGVAVLRRGVAVEALAHGGGQDRGVRSGTLAVALDAACGAAAQAAASDRSSLSARIGPMRDRLELAVTSLPGVRRTGPSDARLASHLHLTIADVDAAALILELDRAELAASAASACTSGASKASHVMQAMGLEDTPLRLTLGWTTTEEDIDRAIDVLTEVIPRLQRAFVPALRSI